MAEREHTGDKDCPACIADHADRESFFKTIIGNEDQHRDFVMNYLDGAMKMALVMSLWDIKLEKFQQSWAATFPDVPCPCQDEESFQRLAGSFATLISAGMYLEMKFREAGEPVAVSEPSVQNWAKAADIASYKAENGVTE